MHTPPKVGNKQKSELTTAGSMCTIPLNAPSKIQRARGDHIFTNLVNGKYSGKTFLGRKIPFSIIQPDGYTNGKY